MEQRLKDLSKELGRAIDESLSGSEEIAEVIAEIRKQGFDVLLVLEATIGFNRRTESPSVAQTKDADHQDLDASLTEQDQKFLKALSISLEE